MEMRFRNRPRPQEPSFTGRGEPDRETEDTLRSSRELREQHRRISETRLSAQSENFNRQNVQADGQ